MPKIQVAQAFTFTDSKGVAERFAVGLHSVSKEVADHPYTAHHLAAAPEPVKSDKKQAADDLAEALRIADNMAGK